MESQRLLLPQLVEPQIIVSSSVLNRTDSNYAKSLPQQEQQQQQQQTAQGVEIRVGVELDVDSFTVGGSTSLAITASNGVQLSDLPAGQAYRVTRSGAGVTVGGQSYSGAVFVQATGSNGLTAINGRYYRGRVLLGARPQGGVSAINWVNIEQYLWGVVGHEVYPSWHRGSSAPECSCSPTLHQPYLPRPTAPCQCHHAPHGLLY